MEMKLGSTIKRLRIEQGITQEGLAEYMGVSFQAVSKWETNTTMPDITLLPKLAVFFGVSIDALFSINNDDELERIDFILSHEKLTDENFLYIKRTLDSILREDENDIGALKRYALLYLCRINRDSLAAGRMLEKAMEHSPLDEEIYALYRNVRGGSIFFTRSGNDWFIRVCEPYAKKYPSNLKLCQLLIEAMIEMRYFERAEELIATVKVYDQMTEMAKIFEGDIQFAKGGIESAKVRWSSVDKENHKGQYEAGERYNRIGEYNKAIECYENSYTSSIVPRDLSAVYSLAFLYTKLGKYQNAIDMWQRILDVLLSDYGIIEGTQCDWPRQEIQKLKIKMNKFV